jgi:hypothetical protein
VAPAVSARVKEVPDRKAVAVPARRVPASMVVPPLQPSKVLSPETVKTPWPSFLNRAGFKSMPPSRSPPVSVMEKPFVSMAGAGLKEAISSMRFTGPATVTSETIFNVPFSLISAPGKCVDELMTTVARVISTGAEIVLLNRTS